MHILTQNDTKSSHPKCQISFEISTINLLVEFGLKQRLQVQLILQSSIIRKILQCPYSHPTTAIKNSNFQMQP